MKCLFQCIMYCCSELNVDFGNIQSHDKEGLLDCNREWTQSLQEANHNPENNF